MRLCMQTACMRVKTFLEMNNIALYCIVLYCIVLYYIALYCTETITNIRPFVWLTEDTI